jgi:hypothetical protein
MDDLKKKRKMLDIKQLRLQHELQQVVSDIFEVNKRIDEEKKKQKEIEREQESSERTYDIINRVAEQERINHNVRIEQLNLKGETDERSYCR